VLFSILAVTLLGEKAPEPLAGLDDGSSPTSPSGFDEPGLINGAVGLAEGDCFVGTSSVSAVGCDEPHDGEVYVVLEHPADAGEDFPGDNVVAAFADGQCFPRFEGYVGRRYAESALDYTIIYPTEEGWERIDDREILCVLVTLDGSRLTGSSRGSGR
jgi:hypothetical protein